MSNRLEYSEYQWKTTVIILKAYTVLSGKFRGGAGSIKPDAMRLIQNIADLSFFSASPVDLDQKGIIKKGAKFRQVGVSLLNL